jgi:pyrroloquinoline quinone (PQQ) biosynthesis protein C
MATRQLVVAAEKWIQLADAGGLERVQLRAENPAAKTGLSVCCSTV